MRQLALAALILAAVPSLAQAEVKQSRVTTPAGPTYRLYEPEPTLAAEPLLEITATTDAENAERIDVICSYGDSQRVVVENKAVEADGSVEVEVPLGSFPVELCDLRVVPAGYRDPDFSSYTGPVVAASPYFPMDYNAPVRGSDEFAVLSYLVSSGHQRAAASITSAGGEGLFAIGVKEQAHEPFATTTWREGAGLQEVMVDGRRAYTTADIPLFTFGTGQATAPAGFEGLQATVTLDESTGALAVRETQRIFRCEGTDSERPREEECRTVLDTGIRLERTIALTREHSIADVRDHWVSSDGRQHQVVATYTVKAPDERKAAEDPLWRFPGDAAFRKYAPGDVPVQGPGTALVRDRNALSAPGALSFAPAPLRFTFGDLGGLDETVQLAVPAGGAAPSRRVFATARDSGEAEVLGRATEDGFEAPRVTIAGAPARGALATVSGRATDNVGVVALTVGGRPAAVASDGSFSVPVALASGANEIVVTATDGAGQSATAQVVVQRGAPRRCRVPKVRAGVRVRAARAALTKAGCRARTRRVASRTVRKGRVVGLTRRSGRTLPFRARVGIRVSAGR